MPSSSVCSPSNTKAGWELTSTLCYRNFIGPFQSPQSIHQQASYAHTVPSLPTPSTQPTYFLKSLHSKGGKKSLFPLRTVCLKLWGCFCPEHWQAIYTMRMGWMPDSMPLLSSVPTAIQHTHTSRSRI